MRSKPAPGDGPAALILPAFNEERGVAATLATVRAAAPDIEVIVVDDGSTDRTAEVAAAAGARVVHHQTNRGKGAAIRTGVLATDATRLVIMDADATYPASAIRPMLDLLAAGHDYVSGTRREGRANIPIVNRLGNATLAAVIRLLSGSKLRDPLSGMYAFRRDALLDIMPRADGFAIETELAMRAARAGLRTAEMPIAYGNREGTSKLRPMRDGWAILTTIIGLALHDWRLRRRRMAG